MSSAGNTLGTQSPPLDATAGQNAPMGVSNIQGDKPDAVPDSKQREQYFDGSQSTQGKDTRSTEQVKATRWL
ncbi:hypothetical protein BC629DRAFT_1599390 [Irpex lacteus]|nr:hypothetical protein BC629DRAFT_1599390 [Irpex lacteus]